MTPLVLATDVLILNGYIGPLFDRWLPLLNPGRLCKNCRNDFAGNIVDIILKVKSNCF